MTASPSINEEQLIRLCAPYSGLVLRRDVALSGCSTFRIGGDCAWMIDCADGATLLNLVRDLVGESLGFRLIGSGSNLVFPDAGWNGLILRFVNAPITPHWLDDARFELSAACELDALAGWAAAEGWEGLEAFSGIPGTVGGAVVGNAGAWGVQMEHVLDKVVGCTQSGLRFSRSVAECGFRYRHSAMKDHGDLVSSVVIHVKKGDPAALQAERKRILELRATKHPDLECDPCAGSFFKNVEPSSAADRRRAAGWFLEQVGAKDWTVGGAAVFHKHANIIIKAKEDCSADDIRSLSRKMAAAVKAEFGLELEAEVRFWE